MVKKYNNWCFESESEMFRFIAETRELKSFLTNKSLPSIHSRFFLNCFVHVLSKAQGKYYKFKLNPNNIILLTALERHLLDFGTFDQRLKYAKKNKCSWQKVYDIESKLKLDYAKFELKFS